MTGAAVEQTLCAKCGADIRPEALFCYNCGGDVKAEDLSQEIGTPSDAWMRGDISENEIEAAPEVVDSPIARPIEEPLVKTEKNKNEEASVVEEPVKEKSTKAGDRKKKKPKNGVTAETKLKSAANLRKKPKSLQQRKVEVIWEERESEANMWFIAATVFITIVVAVLFFLAMYLK